MASIICPICLEKLEVTSPPTQTTPELKPDSGVKVTECGHIFHSSCLQAWVTTECKGQCPTCRRHLQMDKLIDIYPQYDQSFQESDGLTSSNPQEESDEISITPSAEMTLSESQNEYLPNSKTNKNNDIFLKALESQEESARTSLDKLEGVILDSVNKSIGSSITNGQQELKELSVVDRISVILKDQPKKLCSNSVEREMVDFVQSIDSIVDEFNAYSEVVVDLTGIPKNKEQREMYIKALGKLNKNRSEYLAVKGTMEKRIFNKWTKRSLELLNTECNRLSSLLKAVLVVNRETSKGFDAILKQLKNVKSKSARLAVLAKNYTV